MKILIDMNLSPQWVETLKNAGFICVHWSTIGQHHSSDRDIMNWALENDYIVFTNDLDFGAILAATQAHAPSVFQIPTQDLLPRKIGLLVIKTMQQYANHLELGALISVDERRSRIKILPIKKD